MDEDLAFCLGRFIDEQIELMENRIKLIDDEEEKTLEKLYRGKRQFDQRKGPMKDKGSHERDELAVNRFIVELRRINETSETETISYDSNCLEAFRAEILTKLGASSVYLNRLRNIAQTFPHSKKFISKCDETIDFCRRTKTFTENFENLQQILGYSNDENVVKNTQKWWKNSYGSKIAELNKENEKFSRVLVETHYENLSLTSRAIAHAKRLIKLRTIILTKPKKDEYVRRFVDELYSLDEEQRETKSSVDLIDDLLNENIDHNINFAQRWLKKRDAIRNEKIVDIYEEKIEEARAEFGRRRIAQQAKKLALAGLLCRLAVGSTNDKSFQEKLQQTIENEIEKKRDDFPVVSGDVKEDEEIPIVLRFDLEETNLNQWDVHENDFRENLAEALKIPSENIRIDRVDPVEGQIHLRILPPYEKNVVNCLNGNAADAVRRKAALKKCCEDFHVKISTLTLGEFDLEIDDKLMDPTWNRIYAWPDENDDEKTFWKNSIDRGNRPYFCPSGWKRYGVKVAENEREFNEKWGSWNIAYHGTRGEHATNILTSGLRVSLHGCFYEDGEPRVYVSPSIEYSAHPRYAFPWRKTSKNGQELWYQLVFQCRVNPKSIDKICPETLLEIQYKNSIQVDSNFDNNQLEWIVVGNKGIQYVKDDIICYGLMMRVSSIDPGLLPSSSWWKFSTCPNIYKQNGQN